MHKIKNEPFPASEVPHRLALFNLIVHSTVRSIGQIKEVRHNNALYIYCIAHYYAVPGINQE